MTDSVCDSSQKFWTARARNMVRWVGFGWWWTLWMKGVAAGAALASAGLAAQTLRGAETLPVWLGFAAGCLGWGGFAWWRTGQRKMTLETAFSRMDVAYGFHHRLVSAAQGVGAWPPPQPERTLPLGWVPRTALTPLLLSLFLLCVAVWLPVPSAQAEAEAARLPPPAWEEMTRFVEELRQEELVREEQLDDVEEMLRALREQDPEDWYRQGSLETTKQLRQTLERDARALRRNLDLSSALLEAALRHQDEISGEMMEQLDSFFQELLAEMDTGSLPLSEDMMNVLQEIDLSRLQQLSPEQLQELAEQLSGQCDAMGQCMMAGGMSLDELMAGGETGEDGEGAGGDADADTALALLMRMEQGRGGPGEDGSGAPMRLGDRHPGAEGRETLALTNPDLSRAALGDLLDVQRGEHEVEELDLTGPAGGFTGAAGEGEAVWRDDFLPEEAQILQQYFR